MTRKEQFLVLVFTGALAEVLRNDTSNAHLIAQMASAIQEENVSL